MILLPLITLVALKAKIIWVIKIYALGWKMIILQMKGRKFLFCQPSPLTTLWVNNCLELLLTFRGGGGGCLWKIIFWLLYAMNQAGDDNLKLFSQRKRTPWRYYKGEEVRSQDVCPPLWGIKSSNGSVLFFCCCLF